jgi:hypothetical protein
MADRLEWFDITVPAGVTQASPMRFTTSFQQGDVIEIDVKVPPGPSGNVGFFIGCGGSQYVPRTPGTFVIPDNDYLVWPMANAINTGAWFVTAFNTDLYSHLIQVAFHVNELQYAPGMTFSAPIGL